ncbi:hypothetical protein BIW11_03761 [Tropilaelaps mercedesae]|uniref:Uncharacterized protein n=1 Tax=Tropilaelaps mercedesae TaxID=418985 RepID=A0A1V9XGM7_9ACAR|nr:hypothetical protein BIW11_03761 [Tropilaelaps mercedesae]
MPSQSISSSICYSPFQMDRGTDVKKIAIIEAHFHQKPYSF